MDDLGARDLVRDDSYRDGGDVLWNHYAGRAAPPAGRRQSDRPGATSNGYWKTRAKGRSSNMERQF